jgi:hypothetical protein
MNMLQVSRSATPRRRRCIPRLSSSARRPLTVKPADGYKGLHGTYTFYAHTHSGQSTFSSPDGPKFSPT